MDRIFFEGIRCFAARQEVPLAPLTVLVGENSSGKSTVLALVRLAWDLAARLEVPEFNEEPFFFGAYEQIASSGNQDGPFQFGIEFASDKAYVSGLFGPRGGQPVLLSWSLKIGNYDLKVDFDDEDEVNRLALSGLKGPVALGPPYRFFRKRVQQLYDLGTVLRIMEFQARRAREDSVGRDTEILRFSQRISRLSRGLNLRPYAFAPVRTRPQRTYDPVKGAEEPEGSHVPMILASAPTRAPERWKELFAALESFGQHSGLFTKVEIRRLGKTEGDPFQVQVHIGASPVNLIDVGYGVSQVLPIIVDCLRGEKGGTFLLQQPEVHLHPRAQAELGSFLGVLAKQQNKRFVIETHSDYLVDRIRMDIRDKKGLKPEDVSLLYFERKNGQAQIHRLHLDEHGNLLDPPPGYRSFFLEEERRFLGG